MRRSFFCGMILAGLTLAGCTDSAPLGAAATEDCTGVSAQVRVTDGFLLRGCGCAEGEGAVEAGQPFDCTVASGTLVVFVYVGAASPHQIVSVGSPSFVSSAYYDPNDPQTVPSHGVVFDVAGSYAFQDSLTPSLGGTIIVQ